MKIKYLKILSASDYLMILSEISLCGRGAAVAESSRSRVE